MSIRMTANTKFISKENNVYRDSELYTIAEVPFTKRQYSTDLEEKTKTVNKCYG